MIETHLQQSSYWIAVEVITYVILTWMYEMKGLTENIEEENVEMINIHNG